MEEIIKFLKSVFHRDPNKETIFAIIKRMVYNYEWRLHNHPNIESFQLLDYKGGGGYTTTQQGQATRTMLARGVTRVTAEYCACEMRITRAQMNKNN